MRNCKTVAMGYSESSIEPSIVGLDRDSRAGHGSQFSALLAYAISRLAERWRVCGDLSAPENEKWKSTETGRHRQFSVPMN
jgi:hypothetical protein